MKRLTRVSSNKELLKVNNLKTYFYTEVGIVRAVDGTSLKIMDGEIHGIVGESGSGKTVTVLSVLRIVPKPGEIVSGKILFRGEDLVKKSEKEMTKIRGKEIAMTFQDPTSSLNPTFTIGDQITEVIRLHQHLREKEATEKANRLLKQVGITEPEARMKQYPFELSTGMRQRVALARSLSCNPKLLFLDEPTTNLDLTVQYQIIDLLQKLKRETEISMVLITHDIGLIAYLADRVSVMYCGKVLEVSDVRDIFKRPKHPYTEALIATTPQLAKRGSQLRVIPGRIPDPLSPSHGCVFHPRCEYAIQACKEKVPALEEVEPGRYVACLRSNEILQG